MADNTPYDLVLLGASGYTGKLTAEHIALHLPTDLRWAIAGRSEGKLQALTKELRKLNPDRKDPAIEIVSLDSSQLDVLVRKTKVLLNTVGPYHLYGTPVVEACAKNGTHYLDVTGESLWTADMVSKYHKLARTNKAIIIPQVGVESAPSDLTTYALVTLLRHTCECPIAEVTGTMHVFQGTPSGGTLATVLSLGDTYGLKEIKAIKKAYRDESVTGSPIQRPHPSEKPSLWKKLTRTIFGVFNVPELGLITTSITAGPNAFVVRRTWGLLEGGAYYGPRFTYREGLSVSNRLYGFLAHVAVVFGMIAIFISPIRWLMKRIVTAPGDGPDREAAKKDRIDYRALAIADEKSPKPRKALGRMCFEGGMYQLTGIFLAEAAMVLLKEEALVNELEGGILTPAMMGQSFIDRVTKAGIDFEVQLLPA